MKRHPLSLLALVAAAASCAGPFELRVPAEHPSRPEAPSAGALEALSPRRIGPPPATDTAPMEMDGMEIQGMDGPGASDHGGDDR